MSEENKKKVVEGITRVLEGLGIKGSGDRHHLRSAEDQLCNRWTFVFRERKSVAHAPLIDLRKTWSVCL